MSKDEYLITDAPLKALTVFAMPMILGSFFQQVYNMADSIIVGQFVGSSALAAVGACAALTNVFICIALGAGVGAGVLVSRYFGARDYGKMKTIVSTSLISFLVLSVLLGFFGFFFSHSMMSLLQTPADILDEAVLYLRVYFVGFPFLFMYNILSSMFNALGESRIPLYLLIFSSVLNIFLDLYMVATLHLGVAGAAYATFIAQGISAVCSFLIFLHTLRRLDGKAETWFSKAEFSSMSRIALPSILQQSTVSIGMMLVQSVVTALAHRSWPGFQPACGSNPSAWFPGRHRKCPFLLYSTEHRRRKTRTDLPGISDCQYHGCHHRRHPVSVPGAAPPSFDRAIPGRCSLCPDCCHRRRIPAIHRLLFLHDRL